MEKIIEDNLDFFGLTYFVNEIGSLSEDKIASRVEEHIDEIIKRNPPALLEKKYSKYREKYGKLKNSTINSIFGFIDENNGNHLDALFDNTQRMIILLKKVDNGAEKQIEFKKLFLKELKIFLNLHPWLKEMNEKPIIGSIMAAKMEKYGLQGILSGSQDTNAFTKGANRIIQVMGIQ